MNIVSGGGCRDEERGQGQICRLLKVKNAEGGEKERADGDADKRDEKDHCVHSRVGLKCDSCDFWHHTDCEKVSDEVYSFLSSHDNDPSILWYRKCVAKSKRVEAALNSMQEHQQLREEKVNQLSSMVNTKIDDLASELQRKLDATLVSRASTITEDSQNSKESRGQG